MSFVVSLIGRPNVGKSSLFNRLMKRSMEAIAFDKPGVTRDRHYGIMTLDESNDLPRKDVILVDTGGFYPEDVEIENPESEKGKFDTFFNIMREHAQVAMSESDLVFIVMDVREGLLPVDQNILNLARKMNRECWIIVNKFDSHGQDGHEGEFYTLGIDYENIFTVSAAHNLGIPTLRERLQQEVVKKEKELNQLKLQKGVVPAHPVVAKVSILGAPNAGKSTLLNKLLEAPRALVSDIAGTTVDPVEGFFDLDFGKHAAHLNNDPVFVRNNSSFGQQYIKFLQEIKATQKDEDADEFWGDVAGDDNDEDQFVLPSEEEGTEISLEDLEGADLEMDGELADAADQEVAEEMAEEMTGADEGDSVEKTPLISEDAMYEELFAQERAAEQSNIDSENEVQGHSVEDQVTEEQVTEDVVIQEEVPQSTIRTLQIVDTAGIRRANKVEGPIETQAVFRSLKMIQESDIVLYVVDATLGLTHQDRRLCDIALNKGKSVIIVLNKMDLLRDKLTTTRQRKDWIADLRAYISWLDFCECIQISALEGMNLGALKRSLKTTTLIRHREIPTGPLNRLVTHLTEQKTLVLPKSRGTFFKVKYASQVKSAPPTIMLFSNRSQGIPVTYRRFLQNAIRREFKLVNTPVHLLIRTSRDLKLKGINDEGALISE